MCLSRFFIDCGIQLQTPSGLPISRLLMNFRLIQYLDDLFENQHLSSSVFLVWEFPSVTDGLDKLRIALNSGPNPWIKIKL